MGEGIVEGLALSASHVSIVGRNENGVRIWLQEEVVHIQRGDGRDLSGSGGEFRASIVSDDIKAEVGAIQSSSEETPLFQPSHDLADLLPRGHFLPCILEATHGSHVVPAGALDLASDLGVISELPEDSQHLPLGFAERLGRHLE